MSEINNLPSNQSEAFIQYKSLERVLKQMREKTNGAYAQEQGPILDEMTDIWMRLSETEMDLLDAEGPQARNIRATDKLLVPKREFVIGNGQDTQFVIVHNLNSRNMDIRITDRRGMCIVPVRIDVINANSVYIEFDLLQVPTDSQYTVKLFPT